MTDQPSAPVAVGRFPLRAAALLAAAAVACSAYANLSLAVTDPAAYRFFPPFKGHVNAAGGNRHLGGEYFNMARSLVAGEGFAHPFDGPTGPTAWQAPVLPMILAGLLWATGGSRDAVTAVVVVSQVLVLIGTGLLVLALARQTTTRAGAGPAAALFLAALLCDFRLCFQSTHDYWLVLLAVDLLVAWLCWWRPLGGGWRAACGWGLFGGLCALTSPVVAFAWAALSLALGARERAWRRLALAALVAALVLAPWAARNYLVFGRLIPTKANLAYELYQSQCLQPDGLLQGPTFLRHPYGASTRQRREYQALGETAFLDRKWGQFWASVRADPLDFAERAAHRLLAVTVWYVPFDRPAEARRPWVLWAGRLTHPLPFLALLVLLFTAAARRGQRLHAAQWVVVGGYLLYLLPYVVVSYYERYAVPLLGLKVLLVLWAADRLLALLPAAPPAPPTRAGAAGYNRGSAAGRRRVVPA